jgi:hypothetical protein
MEYNISRPNATTSLGVRYSVALFGPESFPIELLHKKLHSNHMDNQDHFELFHKPYSCMSTEIKMKDNAMTLRKYLMKYMLKEAIL